MQVGDDPDHLIPYFPLRAGKIIIHEWKGQAPAFTRYQVAALIMVICQWPCFCPNKGYTFIGFIGMPDCAGQATYGQETMQ